MCCLINGLFNFNDLVQRITPPVPVKGNQVGHGVIFYYLLRMELLLKFISYYILAKSGKINYYKSILSF